MYKRIVMGSALVLVVAGLLAGCGSSGSSTSSGSRSGSFNSADVTFAQGMIPHHRQAVEMAKMAAGHSAGPKVKALATEIEAAQGPEIKQLQAWLGDWGKKETSGNTMSGSDHSGMDHGAMGEGMMSDADMADLDQVTGGEFDKMFLTMMIAHHKGAITMARTELKDGKSSAAKKMARSIITAQEAEIATMQELLSAA